jgi:hypothetical protein
VAITGQDDLNGAANAAIDGRTSSGGQTWARLGGGTLQLDGSGAYGRMSTGSYAVYALGGDQPVADYAIQATWKRPGANFGDVFALFVRAASANSFYALVSNNDVWRIALVTGASGAGGWTSLGSYSAAIADGDVARFEAEDDTLTFFLNSVQRIQVTDATLAGPGKAGVYLNAVNDNTGIGFDNVSITTFVAEEVLYPSHSIYPSADTYPSGIPGTYVPGGVYTAVIEPIHITGAVEAQHATGAIEPTNVTGVIEPAYATAAVEATHKTGVLEVALT